MKAYNKQKTIQEKCLVIGDIHIGNNKNNPIFFDTAINYAKWIKGICNENKITQIIQLGDILHDRNHVHLSASNCVYDFFTILAEFDIHVTVGNHECLYNNNTIVNSLKLLSEWPNITIHDKVTTVDDVTFCGWGTKLEDIPDRQKIIFGHFDIKGFDMSASKVAEHGFTASELMERCEILMSGHYHKPQRRFYKNKLLTYAGSCYQLNWGESGEEKYAYILDTESLSYEAIPNNISPRFEYIRSEKDYHKIANNFVAIESNSDDYDTKVAQMLANNALDIKNINKPVKRVITEEVVEEFKGINISEVIQEYVELIEEISDDEKKYLAQKANQLYDQCI
jgi:DNA repair exonuclease SbcCD nuclease subunit